MKAILNTQVTLGLMNVPVKIYSATEDHDIKFHQVHSRDGGQIRYKRVCEACGDLVEYADIAKAYSDENDQTIILSEEDLSSIDAGHRPIEVLEFVPAGGIDPLMYDKSYYLGPDTARTRTKAANPASLKAYTLLAQILSETEQTAIVQFTMRSKTRLAALSVTGKQGALVLHTLQWPDEVREPDFPDLDSNKPEIKDIEIETGIQLVEALSAEGFNPDHYRDLYQEQLKDLFDAKLRGELPSAPEGDDEAPEDISDLLAKLQESVKRATKDSGTPRTRVKKVKA